MLFEYRLLWRDHQGRPWSSEIMKADNPTDARRMHRSSGQFHWVTEDMVDPMVSPLFVEQSGREVMVEDDIRPESLQSRLLSGR